jgi:hypothetical protein
MYFTATDLYTVLRAGPPFQGLVFIGGPFVIGLVTLLGVFRSIRQQGRRRDWM